MNTLKHWKHPPMASSCPLAEVARALGVKGACDTGAGYLEFEWSVAAVQLHRLVGGTKRSLPRLIHWPGWALIDSSLRNAWAYSWLCFTLTARRDRVYLFGAPDQVILVALAHTSPGRAEVDAAAALLLVEGQVLQRRRQDVPW